VARSTLREYSTEIEDEVNMEPKELRSNVKLSGNFSVMFAEETNKPAGIK